MNDDERVRLLVEGIVREREARAWARGFMTADPDADPIKVAEWNPYRVTTPGCTCPSGLSYRFHRHPCPRTGEIEPRDTPPGGKS